ncbi:MAG: hypothetical protein GX230_02235 [Lentisphaerae bacterium]|mgnify:CR=1 FL=1|jgi:hypothetical protein|nr:hypothetical protein [Lentisphaerota bacterium]
MNQPFEISAADRDILRRIAATKVELAHSEINQERRRAWLAHDTASPLRPMILAESFDIRDSVKVFDPTRDLLCSGDWARTIEHQLFVEIHRFANVADDHVIEPWYNLNWHVSATDYGLNKTVHTASNNGHLGANNWEPALHDFDADFKKLHQREFSVDRPTTLATKEAVDKIIGDIIPTRIRGSFYWTMGMTIKAIDLIGLENLMLFMYDNPDGLHRLMSFLCEDAIAEAEWLEREELLSLNNENDYIGSGSEGYTCDLPQPDLQQGSPVRMKDCWVLSESQETVGVGPDLFAEFIFPYQQKIAEKFGKCYYGCCEPVDNRWHILKQLTNLARVSVSPWANQEFMADACGRNIVFSRKPNPALISTAAFNEDAIRNDLRHTLQVARNCSLEIIMKDVHTLNNQPGRLKRWVELAREESQR